MELAKMLQYQKIDMGIYKQEKEFNQSKEKEMLTRLKKSFDEKKASLIALSKELDNTLANINKLSEKINEISGDSIWETFDVDASDEEALATADKKFAEYEEKIAELNKELAKAIKKEEEIAIENKRLHDAMFELDNTYRHTSALIEKKKAELLTKIKPALLQLKSLTPDIDEKLYNKYTELRKAKKMPALMVYIDGCCGACGMNIEIEVGKKLLESGDLAECPNCGRLVYKA